MSFCISLAREASALQTSKLDPDWMTQSSFIFPKGHTQSLHCSCHLRLHACNRSLFARGLSIDSRAYVISQHARWPIRTPLPTCANQDAWVVITPKRSKANSIHTAAWHAWTAVFSLIHFPASFIRLWPSCHFDLGGSRHGWGLFLEQTGDPSTLLKRVLGNYCPPAFSR